MSELAATAGYLTRTLIAVCALAGLAIGQAAPRQAEAPGSARAQFELGLTSLHHFEYEDALEHFERSQALDPGFALAYWGEAMTYDQTLWRRQNLDAGRQALAKLAPTSAARAARAGDERARGLIAAADALFGSGDSGDRHRAYAEAMGRLHERLPDDPDVASLYALALIAGASRSLIGYQADAAHAAGPDLHVPGLAGSETQSRAAAILNQVLAAHPDHPGALHYLLHTYDDPEHARLALAAARKYAAIAGGASHALHMPAHIFLQLGLWHDAAASDRHAYDASRDWVERKKLPAALRNFHALSWLQYELLQLGRYREARQLIDEIAPVARAAAAQTAAGAHQPLQSDLSSMRARYAIETGRWDFFAGEQNFGNVDELFAIGLSAAHAREFAKAERAREVLAGRSRAPEEGDLRPAIAIMERELAGVIAAGNGRTDEAIRILQASADAELRLPPPLGLPAPAKPAPELLGEALVTAGRPGEAIAPFESVLARHAGRSSALLGLARAEKARGNDAAAGTRYREFLANLDAADADIPALVEARAAVAGGAARDDGRAIPVASWAAGGAAAVFAVLVAVMRSRRGARVAAPRRAEKRNPAKRTPKTRKHEA